MSQKNISYLS